MRDKTKVVYVGQKVIDNDRRNRGVELVVVDFTHDKVALERADGTGKRRVVSRERFGSKEFERTPRRPGRVCQPEGAL